MLLERIYDEDLAQASYFIGCQAKNEAIVVDPRRDVQEYLDLAAHHGMTITHVTETHIHADFLSGTRELAARTGAQIHVSGEGGEDWTYGFEGNLLHDGDVITLGNITVTAQHTPGHTPEHLSYLITDGAFAQAPGYYLTGDFVFSGDLGRPDLLDEAAGFQDTRFAGAKQLFRSLKEKFVGLPDHVQVFPGHGSGSACGKALGALPSTTVGYERTYAWWAECVANDDEQGFVDELLDGQPDAHAYFARMKKQNKLGPAVLGELTPLAELTGEQAVARVAAGDVLADTRSVDEIHAGTVPGALALPAKDKAATHIGWAYDPEQDDAAIILLADDQDDAEAIRSHMIRVGVDAADAFVTSLDGFELQPAAVISPEELQRRIDAGDVVPATADAAPGEGGLALLDVRNRTEHAEGTVPASGGAEAAQLNSGKVLFHQRELPKDATLVTFCQSGLRNVVAAQSLRRAGFDVVELQGSYLGWLGRTRA